MTSTNDIRPPVRAGGPYPAHNALLAGVLVALAANVASAQDDTGTAIDEVEVFATPLDNTIDEIGQGVTVLQGDDLSRQLANTIGETLALQPGVTSSDFGAGASRPVVRGLAGPRVRVQEDGISTLDVSTISVDHAVALEPLVIERVEILRGPATLAYGSGAVGGVVNTISERLPDSLTEDGIDGRFQVTGNTVADERHLALGLNGSTGNIAWHLDGMARDAGNYEIPGVAIILEDFEEEQPDGFVQNSDLESSSWGAGLGWVGDRAFLSFAVSGFDTNYGLPTIEEEEEEEGEEGGEEEEEGPIRLDLQQTRFDFKGGFEPQNGFISRVEVRGAYNDYDHVEFEGDETGTTFDNEAFEGRIDISHAPIGNWEGAFGLQVDLRDFSAIGAEAFVPPTETTAVGIYLIEELDVDEWFFSFGGRIETQEQEPLSGENVDDTAFSISASAIRELAQSHRLGLTLSSAQRLPSAEELFSDGPHLATSTFEIGDPDLDVETSLHAELSWRYAGERVSFSATGFVTSFQDFIFLAETADVEDGLPVFLWTQADADFVGAEVEFFANLATVGAGDLDLSLFADAVSGELNDGGNLPRISPARLGGRLQYQSERIIAGVDLVQVFDQDDVAEFESETDGYTMLNLDLAVTVAQSGQVPVELFLRGTNLLDEEARRHVSFVKDLAPLPGRNFTLGLRGRF